MLVASLDVEQKSLEVITRSLVMMVELKIHIKGGPDQSYFNL